MIPSECYAQTHDVFLKSGARDFSNTFVTDQALETESALQKRYIVRLQNAAVTTTAAFGRQQTNQLVLSEHEKFQEDFSRILNKNTAARTSGGAEILLEYVNVFNGFAIRADQSTIDALKALDYVSEVFEDQVIYAQDLESSKIISADKVWDELGVTGKNVSIAIIDTGIDYNHQDLGGGFGDNYKVKGGYDFVNNDNDPVDDHGHGTHVAGIAAGNGPGLKGVAPDANLYAYKVLSSAGSGYDSWIIAAIERVVDPDQNPSTDDKHDVANMSLGRPLGDSDPVSEAVNNAVRNGVTFVVSGGNASDYGTIGTPAISALAITVAATDFNDSTAYFSSKGPTEGEYAIKPDVAAPGVKIYSSVLGNSYAKYSGTSMASPHVTGAVALLLEKNPDWTPDIIKSALMGTAVNTHNEMIWHQGAGRINVRHAIEAKCVAVPGSLSLGVAGSTGELWTTSKTVSVKNTSDQTLALTLSAIGEEVGANIQVKIDPSEITVAPGTAADVLVTFSVKTNTLPFKNYPEAYSGLIRIASVADTIKVPYAFLHASTMKISFTGELPLRVFVLSRTTGSIKTYYPTGDLSAMLPTGEYDVIAYYSGNYFVIQEKQNSLATFTIAKSQAKNKVVFDPKDKNGNVLPITSDVVSTTVLSGSTTPFMLYYTGFVRTFYFSNQSTYGVETKIFDRNPDDPKTYYDITMSSGYGILQNLSISNNPTEFTDVQFENPSVPLNTDQELTYYIRSKAGLLINNTAPMLVTNPLRILHTRNGPTTIILGEVIKLCAQQKTAGSCWETQVMSVGPGTISFADFLGNKFNTVKATSFYQRFDRTLPYLNATLVADEGNISLRDSYKFGIFNRYYGERENGTVRYELTKDGTTFSKGTLPNRMIDDGYDGANLDVKATPGNYVLKLAYDDYKTENFSGKIAASLTFNTAQTDMNPPLLANLYLESLGQTTVKIDPGANATLRFSVKDCLSRTCNDFMNVFAKVDVQLRSSDSATWSKLAVNSLTFDNFAAQIPKTLSDGFYDLKLTVQDKFNNVMDYEIAPAFVVGDPSKLIRLLAPLRGSSTTRLPQFKWSKLDDGTNYEISIASDKNFSNQKTYTVSDTTFIPPVLLEKSTVYFWHVQANEGSGKRLSQTFEFTTGDEDWSSIQLLSPLSNTVSNPLTRFTWSSGDTTAYRIQISSDSDFKTFTYDSIVSGTEIALPLSPLKKYFWHVQSADKFALWSETWTINILAPSFGPLEPVNHAREIALDCTLKWSSANGAARYAVYISRDSLFTSELYTRFVDDTIFRMDVDPNSRYFWKINAMYADTTIFSETFTFRTNQNQVTLLAPANNATEQPLSITCSWTRAITNGYTMEVADNTSFSARFATLKINDSTHVVSGLSPGRKYFWRVKPTRDNSSWSAVNTFTTTTPDLLLTSPANQAEDVQQNTDLTWEQVDGVSDYTLLFALADGNSKNVMHNGISQNHFLISDLPPGQLYAWKIGANFADTTIWSEEFRFRTATRYGFETNEFQAFPNPSTGAVKFKINFFEKGNAELYVTNASGLIIYSSGLGQIQGEKIISWDGFDNFGRPISNGIYIAFVKIGSASKPIKLVISK
jgi:subtilisin family serine protease